MPSTVLAALPATLLATAASLGHDAGAVRARAGIPVEALVDPDARIPFDAHARLWEGLAALGDDIGLAIGERIASRALGVVGHAMAHAETVREAWSCVERFRRLVLDDALPRLRLAEDEASFVQPLPPRFARLRHPAECQAAATLTTIRALSGDRALAARRVAFMHPAPADLARHRALFGTRAIAFGAAINELVLDAAVLDRPLARADPALRDYLIHRADLLTRELGDDARIADRVRRAIVLALPGGEPSAGAIARALGTSARTLQRRLAGEGSSVAAILEEVRRERALAMLADRGRRIGEIAYALGYRDATTFARAFRRWTGTAPEAWRVSQ